MDVYIEELEGSLWVASLTQGRLKGLEIDPSAEEVRWGSVYFAKVLSVDKALDAVYVDLDGENTGIVFNSDVRVYDKKGESLEGQFRRYRQSPKTRQHGHATGQKRLHRHRE